MHYDNAGMFFYGIIVFVSLIAALTALKVMKYPEIKSGFELWRILPVLIAGAIIGAKLPVLISYGLRPEMMWTGKSYYGALLGAFIALNIYKAAAGIKGNTGDRFVVPLCLSASIGKIGCFVYGCCAGLPTDFILRIKNHAGVYSHPAQLYEAVFQALAAVIFIYIHKINRLQGAHFMLYLLFYMAFRFFMEFLRTEPRLAGGITVYQWMSIIFVPLISYTAYRRLKNAA